MSDKNCAGCLFFFPRGKDEPGHCRRYPPTLMYQPQPVQTVAGGAISINWSQQASCYPLVLRIGWCGEYEDAPPKSAIEL